MNIFKQNSARLALMVHWLLSNGGNRTILYARCGDLHSTKTTEIKLYIFQLSITIYHFRTVNSAIVTLTS